MPQPVKLSDALIGAAREAAALTHRSLASQVEHWATLGRAIDGQLTKQQTADLVRGVQEARAVYGSPVSQAIAERITATIESVRSGNFGREIRESLHATSGPIYGTHPDFPGQMVRRNPDGTLTPGQLVGRNFMVDEVRSAAT
jgi:ParD-like antitoxin of type II bacterial toxin-antitoxin system